MARHSQAGRLSGSRLSIHQRSNVSETHSRESELAPRSSSDGIAGSPPVVESPGNPDPAYDASAITVLEGLEAVRTPAIWPSTMMGAETYMTLLDSSSLTARVVRAPYSPRRVR